MTRKNNGRGKAADARARRHRILRFIKKYGRWAVDRHSWANKENVGIKTIDSDLLWLKEHYTLDKIDVDEIKFELHDGLKELLTQARLKALSADNDRARNQWSNTYSGLAEKFTRLLEDFHVKQKAAEQVNVQGQTAELIAQRIVEGK